MSSDTQCLFVFSSHLEKNTIIIDCFEILIERPSNLLERAQTFSSVPLDSWDKRQVFFPAGNTTNKLFHMFRENWKNSTLILKGWSGFVQPLQIFPHLLLRLSKLISFCETLISLRKLVRQNWCLILRKRYVWHCIVLASHNNTSQKHSNVEWSEIIQKLAVLCINLSEN